MMEFEMPQMTEIEKCPRSRDGKHSWTIENRFFDKCAACGKKQYIFE